MILVTSLFEKGSTSFLYLLVALLIYIASLPIHELAHLLVLRVGYPPFNDTDIKVHVAHKKGKDARTAKSVGNVEFLIGLRLTAWEVEDPPGWEGQLGPWLPLYDMAGHISQLSIFLILYATRIPALTNIAFYGIAFVFLALLVELFFRDSDIRRTARDIPRAIRNRHSISTSDDAGGGEAADKS